MDREKEIFKYSGNHVTKYFSMIALFTCLSIYFTRLFYIFFKKKKNKKKIFFFKFKVSPTEIENIILAHPAIAEVCVIGILDPDGLGHLPRAVCIPVPEATVTPEEIQEYTNGEL